MVVLILHAHSPITKTRHEPSIYTTAMVRQAAALFMSCVHLDIEQVAPPRSSLPTRSFRLHKQGEFFQLFVGLTSTCTLPPLAGTFTFQLRLDVLNPTNVASRDRQTNETPHVEDQYQPRPCPCRRRGPFRTVAAALRPQPRHSSITTTPTRN